jgi:hypothetical protein
MKMSYFLIFFFKLYNNLVTSFSRWIECLNMGVKKVNIWWFKNQKNQTFKKKKVINRTEKEIWSLNI